MYTSFLKYYKNNSKYLTYDFLRSELDVSDNQELEELLLDLIFNKLINATLDEKDKVVHVEWTFGRDAKPEDIDQMLAKLEGWVKTMERVEKSIESTIDDLDNSLKESKEEKSAFIQQFFETQEEVKKGTKEKSGGFASMLKIPSKILGK